MNVRKFCPRDLSFSQAGPFQGPVDTATPECGHDGGSPEPGHFTGKREAASARRGGVQIPDEGAFSKARESLGDIRDQRLGIPPSSSLHPHQLTNVFSPSNPPPPPCDSFLL